MLWVGVLLLSTLAVARWPDRIVADARGISWVDEDGASRFFENENALVVTGSIPWAREVVCERDGVRKCEEALERATGQFGIALMVYPKRCIRMNCFVVPNTDKVEITYHDFFAKSHIINHPCKFSDDQKEPVSGEWCKWEDISDFSPDKFLLNLRAIPSLSLLWHIK